MVNIQEEGEFLTIAELDERTRISGLRGEILVLKELWLDAANGYVCEMNLDKTKKGFASAMQIIVQEIVESLYVNKSQASIMAANSPFRQEKMGNYSYTLKSGVDMQLNEGRDGIEQSLTPIAGALLAKYRLNRKKFVFNTHSIFTEKYGDIPDINLKDVLSF